MKLSKETKKLHRSLIRKIITIDPEATIFDIQKAVEKEGYHMERHYIGKHVNAIQAERKIRIDFQLVNVELAKFEDVINMAAMELWGTISQPESQKDKTAAIKVLVENYDRLFDKKFDAGVFTRKLGEQVSKHELTPEQAELLKRAIDYADTRGSGKITEGSGDKNGTSTG